MVLHGLHSVQQLVLFFNEMHVPGEPMPAQELKRLSSFSPVAEEAARPHGVCRQASVGMLVLPFCCWQCRNHAGDLHAQIGSAAQVLTPLCCWKKPCRWGGGGRIAWRARYGWMSTLPFKPLHAPATNSCLLLWHVLPTQRLNLPATKFISTGVSGEVYSYKEVLLAF